MSPYGTFDQGGNVSEWNEAIVSGAFRSVRSGAFDDLPSSLASSFRYNGSPATGLNWIGFRVAPEPGRNLLLVAGVLSVFGLAGWRRVRT